MIAHSHFSVSHQNVDHAPYELSNSSCFVLPTTQKFIPKFVVCMASIAYSIWMIGSESSLTSTFLSIVNYCFIMSTIRILLKWINYMASTFLSTSTGYYLVMCDILIYNLLKKFCIRRFRTMTETGIKVDWLT